MPKQPAWIDKVNGIIKFVQNPCDAPWTVYFETALEPAGDAIIVLLSFGLDDVLRGFFRPKGLRSGRHGRRGRRGGKGGLAIPEIGEMIGKNLPGAEEARGRRVTQGVKNLWLIDGVLQRALFWWLVIDVTTDFLYDWSSALEKTVYCQKAHLAALLHSRVGGSVIALAGWAPFFAPVEEYNRGGIVYAPARVILPAGFFHIAASVSTRRGAGAGQTIELAIQIGGGIFVATSGPAGSPSGGGGQAVVSTTSKGPGEFVFVVKTNIGNVDFENSTISVMQTA